MGVQPQREHLDGPHPQKLEPIARVALLIEAGEHVKVIQSRLGHSSARITLDVYGPLFDGIDEAAAERLDGAVSEAAVRIVRGFGEVADLG